MKRARMLAFAVWLSCATALQLALAAPAPTSWTQLSPAQQQALAPLQTMWPRLSPWRRNKWLRIAARYPKMTPQQQAVLQQRMSQWANMTPQQRSQARQNFLASRRARPGDHKQDWERYRSLPPAQRDALAAAARKPPKTPLPLHNYGVRRKLPASAPALPASTAIGTATRP